MDKSGKTKTYRVKCWRWMGDDQPSQKDHMSLRQLFNLESEGWHVGSQNTGIKTLNEELEYFELLDLDAAGGH
jgi:hypothetical protein